MTREDIMEMAREAKLFQHVPPTKHVLFIYDILTFAELVAAHEREAAAKECETLLPSQRIYDRRFYDAVGECVATIRARGEK